MTRRSLSIESADGLRLEAILDEPDDARAALVFCHPHPQMGGTMNAPLLEAVTERMTRERWAVLRFNFRGLGGSEGQSSTGIAEVADAHGAIAAMRESFAEVPVAIAGWSFGGAVAIRAAAEDDSLTACVAIAPAVTEKRGVTAGLPRPEETDLGVPLLMIVGVNDDVVDVDACTAWVAGIPHAEAVVVPGANHYFWGRYDSLGDHIAAWLARFTT